MRRVHTSATVTSFVVRPSGSSLGRKSHVDGIQDNALRRQALLQTQTTLMNHPKLLAKSYPGEVGCIPHAVTLLGHLQAVHTAAETVLDVAGQSMIQAFGFTTELLPRFRRIVTLAAAIHDVGKANNHFLGMLQRSSERQQNHFRQALRHEWVSWWWLHLHDVRKWACSVLEHPDDFHVVACCVCGHHPAAKRPTPPEHLDGAGAELEVLTGHPDFLAVVDWLNNLTPSNMNLPPGHNQSLLVAQGHITDSIANITRQVNETLSFFDQLEYAE